MPDTEHNDAHRPRFALAVLGPIGTVMANAINRTTGDGTPAYDFRVITYGTPLIGHRFDRLFVFPLPAPADDDDRTRQSQWLDHIRTLVKAGGDFVML